MSLRDAIRKRESVRSYKRDKVPHELIRGLIMRGQEAPSACNLQLTEYIIVDDDALLAKLAKKVTGKFAWSPTFIVFIYDRRFTIKRYAALVSLGAAAENIMLSAVSHGLATCPMAGFDDDAALKRTLCIPEPYDVGLIMAVGYPDVPPLDKDRERTPVEDVIHFNRYERATHLMSASADLRQWTLPQVIQYRERLAPVYMYGKRFNLQSFPREHYADVWNTLRSFVAKGSDKESVRIADLETYDAAFARAVLSDPGPAALTATDHFRYPLDVLAGSEPSVKTALIENGRVALPDASHDIVTWVHKIDFSPVRGELFAEARRILKPGGYLYITVPMQSVRSRLRRLIRNLKKLLRGETFNVYENNPYYKIGPLEIVKPRTIQGMAVQAGFVPEAAGVRRVSGEAYIWQIYRKAQ